MKHLFPLFFVAFALLVVFVSCGDNLAGSGSDSTFLPPKDLKALSLNSTSVRLSWSPPGGATDSGLRGYVLRWNNKEDSVGRSTLVFQVDTLNPVETVFFIFSRKVTGELSEPRAIRWAPAARFDSAYVLYEYSLQDPRRPAAFHVGTRLTNPFTLAVDPSAFATMDLYLYGGHGQIAEPLSIWSASMFLGGFKSTRFSTTADKSGTLDFPLSAFPDPTSFAKDTIIIADSTIYYARITGDNQDVHYARILVRVRSNTSFPNRVVDIRVSLQKTPGVMYAESAHSPALLRCRSVLNDAYHVT